MVSKMVSINRWNILNRKDPHIQDYLNYRMGILQCRGERVPAVNGGGSIVCPYGDASSYHTHK